MSVPDRSLKNITEVLTDLSRPESVNCAFGSFILKFMFYLQLPVKSKLTSQLKSDILFIVKLICQLIFA
jgi:hypothetical protein